MTAPAAHRIQRDPLPTPALGPADARRPDARLRVLISPTQPADNSPVELISPELALVDPLLRASALATLPDPGDCLASRRWTYVDQRIVPLARMPNGAGDSETSSPVRLDRAIDIRGSSSNVPADATFGNPGTSLPALAALVAAFLFAYFLGSPLIDLLGAAVSAALDG